MSYQEREIPKDKLEKFLERLDSDEGIRIDNEKERIFINRLAGRYCINISRIDKEEFFYENTVSQVTDFLEGWRMQKSKIFAY
jgi:ribosome-interacting GTPase 1